MTFLMRPNTPFINTFVAAVVATPVNFLFVVWYHLGMYTPYVFSEILFLALTALFSIFKFRSTIIAANRFICTCACDSRDIFRCGIWRRRDNSGGRS